MWNNAVRPILYTHYLVTSSVSHVFHVHHLALKVIGTDVAQIWMQPGAVIKHGDVIQYILLSVRPRLITAHWIRSCFSEPKKLSITALSQQFPRRLMLPCNRWALSSRLNALLAYGDPRSEWWIKQAFGRHCQIAMSKVSQTGWAFIRELILYPTIFLEHKSITTAKYNHPFWVQMYVTSEA